MPERSHTLLPKGTIKKETLVSLLCQTLKRMGQKRAIIFVRNGIEETDLSFLELDRDSDSMAHSFLEMGVRKGDCVILFLPKSVDWVVAHIALQKIGAISIPINHASRKGEVAFYLQETRPSMVVVGIEQEEIVRSIDPNLATTLFDTEKPYKNPVYSGDASAFTIPEDVGLEDPGIIIFTSGTTGRPKGAVLTQGNLSHDAQNVIGVWEIRPNDTLCHALPLFHVHGLCFGLHTALLAGVTTVMLDYFRPEQALDILSNKDCTMFMAVPTMYTKLIESSSDIHGDFTHLRLMTSGSAPLLEKDFVRIAEVFGKEPVEREGMSETLMNFSNPIHGTRKPGSIGLPMPYLHVRIVRPETFKDVLRGEIGEIWLKGPGITPGYWRKTEETERAFEDGWFRTGDLGRRDEEGYYYLTDRMKNIIISGGENVSPKEVERVINTNDDVVESCVVGIPDETWGEIVVAAVVLRAESQLTPDKIRALCKESLLDWKCPKRVLFLDELPKNRMGKVLIDRVRGFFIR
jgi:malonyl-CoA/methylmalonyl-CoA synthetase